MPPELLSMFVHGSTIWKQTKNKGHRVGRQKFCRYKIMFVATNICRDKSFVATKYVFCRVCCDKTFVATKLILVAAPANDISPSPHPSCQFLFGDNSAYDKLSISSPANHKYDGDSGGKEVGFSRPISEAIQA